MSKKAEEVKKEDYRVQTIESFWYSKKAKELEQLLNECGDKGWKVISPHNFEI